MADYEGAGAVGGAGCGGGEGGAADGGDVADFGAGEVFAPRAWGGWAGDGGESVVSGCGGGYG